MPENVNKAALLHEPEEKLKKQSQFLEVARRLMKHKMAVLGLAILVFYLLMMIIGPMLSPYNYADFDLMNRNADPSWAHPCGTDDAGRDVLLRLMIGTRCSLLLGVGAVVIGLVFGLILGCIAGYFGGWVEEIIMRLGDLVQSIPSMLLAVIISVTLGTGVWQTVVALGVGRITMTSRLIRAQFLSERNLEYVEAARATNCSKPRQMFVHILPNTISPLIVNSTMGVSGTIMMAANLSFINLGVRPPTPEWGVMITEAVSVMRHYPIQVLFPGLFMAIFALALNLFGDGLRDALDPKLKT